MVQQQTKQTEKSSQIEVWDFVGRRSETDDTLSTLSDDSQAALRQYSLERTIGYGVDYADAVELRARVLNGTDWQAAATAIAQSCLVRAVNAVVPTQIAYMRRASALLRMSQVMMINDTAERRDIFAQAADLYFQASVLDNSCERVLLDTPCGPVAGWVFPAKGTAVGSSIVIGGTEGWAMDFDCLGLELAERGVNSLMLDAPGQGETRFAHHHYLSSNWREAFRCATDYLEHYAPELPIGFIGNSMGGSLAMAYTADDIRIRACCNNGGPFAPSLAPQNLPYFVKIMAFCGVKVADEATEILKTITPMGMGVNINYPLLLVHGAEDHLVSNEIAKTLYDGVPTQDKRMVVFSDGDHCIYRRRQDRDILIADWLLSRLTTGNQQGGETA